MHRSLQVHVITYRFNINVQSYHYKAFLSRRCLDIELICKLGHGIHCLGLGSNRVLVFHDCFIIYVS